ncbi:hypothetical protein SSP24_79110 [Streptomyces spinoverrucosus]|uniref:Resuscitation-promoting factor core lysozyme-like domain-containing protein n=1 Tax=Streptomyces spinoverrucosus TaxID=284043 RepID=A0A4Y3VYZ6_9ACTN|nr:transglycosylase family protein [Streptomyces spinoverrucosus]GEC10256.1 hypothetical protein SSP24_79110 [Streptomyces spinoverrucosus]GHB97922.1 hypothetical protein GCM10010397_83090 [Streptomyces spinoverrucosus]
MFSASARVSFAKKAVLVAVSALGISLPAAAAGQAHAADAGTWDRLAACESSGNWATHTGNGFRGGLQFTDSTWREFGGTAFAPTADQASREQQIVIAERVLHAQGWHAWPSCSQQLGLSR